MDTDTIEAMYAAVAVTTSADPVDDGSSSADVAESANTSVAGLFRFAVKMYLAAGTIKVGPLPVALLPARGASVLEAQTVEPPVATDSENVRAVVSSGRPVTDSRFTAGVSVYPSKATLFCPAVGL